MELVFRVSAAALSMLILIMLLKKSNPELSVLLSLTAVILMLFASLKSNGDFSELGNLLRSQFGLNESYIRPVIKCVAAAVVTKITADLCRDSSQSAAASAVELAGTLCAIGIMMPLLLTMLKMVGAYL